jgi:hypothetical protein
LLDSNQITDEKTARSPRKDVERPALVVHDYGRVIVPCTMVNASRSGLGLHVPSNVALPDNLLVIDVAGNVVFEGRLARRNGETCGLRYQSVHLLAALPERLQFLATIRCPVNA